MSLHGIDSIGSMNRELTIRCNSSGLNFDCGAGGLFNANIVVVAEAPGERERSQKSPLVGGSGRLLWDTLRRDGISRNHCYVTNVVKRQLIAVSDHAGKPKIAMSRHEKDHWNAILIDELSLLPNMRYVLALGNFAIEALIGESGITNWRGSVVDVSIHGRPVKVICAYNPAHVLRDPKLELTFRMDCHKLTRVIKGEHSTPPITELINPSFQEARDYIDMCKRSGLAVSYDIETMAEETACVGLAVHNNEGMCINFRQQRSNRYEVHEERQLRLALQDLLGDTSVKLIAQNGMFDASWLWYKDRIKPHGHWFDTMLAHHTLYPPLPHNLGYITSQYTDYPYYKDEGKTWREDGDIDQFWRYNVKDCVVTRIAAFAMLTELRDQGMERFFFDHVMRLQPHLIAMTIGGVKIDVEYKQQLSEELGRDVEQARLLCVEKARVATGNADYDFNPNSTKQLGDLFFNDLRLVGRGTSTDDENRRRMFGHPRTSPEARELIQAIDKYKEGQKFLSTYVNCGIDPDGRVRCEYKQTGVQSAPGRLSSSKTSWESGMNLQNQTERSKEMFIADEGYEFSYFDLSQVEARIVAVLADIKTWQEQFERARLNPGSYDAHRALAADMWKVPYDDVPSYDFNPDGSKTIRYKAKRARHGLNYRMEADRLATTAGLPLREAEEIYRIYHRLHPELQRWWDDCIQRARRDRRLETCFGRRWLLLERFDDEALVSIVAFEPQATNGDKVSSVIYQCHEDPLWPKGRAHIILNIHDALVALNRPEDGPLVRSIMKKHAEAPLHIRGKELIVPAEFGVSQAVIMETVDGVKKWVPHPDGIHRWSSIKKIKVV